MPGRVRKDGHFDRRYSAPFQGCVGGLVKIILVCVFISWLFQQCRSGAIPEANIDPATETSQVLQTEHNGADSGLRAHDAVRLP